MERYEFSEREKQLFRALSENKKPEELEQLFDKDVLEAHLNRLQELEMAVAHFSEDGVLAAWLTPKGSAYMKENPTSVQPIDASRNKKKAKSKKRKRLWAIVLAILGFIGLLVSTARDLLDLITKLLHLPSQP